MNAFLRGMVRAVTETFELPGPVLEIGAYRVPGQEDLANLRPFFQRQAFLGVDTRPGPGVDLVASVEGLPQRTGSVGTVVAIGTFEHVQRFWLGFEEIFRVLRPDGAFLLASPFYFHIHGHPHDYWRFTPDALRLLLEDYRARILGWHGPRTRPANVWALAFREQAPAISAKQYEDYRHRMKQYAHMPLPWMRRMRYQMGRLLCGRRPFAPYLDRECWETELEQSPRYDMPHSQTTMRVGSLPPKG